MIFLDTNYLVSYFIATEKHHKKALEISKEIKGRNQIISRLIIAETVNVLYHKLKLDMGKIKEVYNKLNKNYTLIEDHYFYDKTLEIMDPKKRLPFFDYVFITLMKETGIEEIVSFDKHFDNINGIRKLH